MGNRALGQAPLVGQTLGHYRIVEKIGAGGMGEVYLARDEHLARDVAIKVLPPGTLIDESDRKHFHKEALILSQLNHPNVATIHDFDTQQEVDFLVMEYISGITLSEKVAAAPLPEKDILRLGVQLAEGLSAAHEHGVVHRDVKPGNLRVTTDGRLKILDFGLAKLRLPVTDSAATESFGEPHTMAGTLPYMAPEQLLDGTIDARTDIHAAGSVLYEMATGQRPFADVEGSQLIGAILRRPPRPPTALNPRLSPEVERIIGKCLEKEPESRYQSAKELAIDLRRLQTGAVSAVQPAATPARWSIAKSVGLGLGILASVIVLLIALNVGRVRERVLGRADAPRIESLAVLPVKNFSGDPAQEFFADGMTDALIAGLARIKAVKVISRTSVMQYKDTKKSLPQIAGELGVDGIVEASVMRSGGRVRITAQLIEARQDRHLWASNYEREMKDVLALQSELVQAIAGEIRVHVTPDERLRLVKAPVVNADSYDAYLQGKFYRLRRDVDTAERYFRLALEKDSNYAPAHAGMGIIWLERSDLGQMSPTEVMPKARAELARALQLDESNGEALNWLAIIAWSYDWNWTEGEEQFRRALELSPNDAEAHFQYADFLVTMKRTAEWQREMDRAIELDPPNVFYRVFRGWHLLYLHREDEAISECEKVLRVEPENSSAHMCLWGAHYRKSMPQEALAAARKFFSVLKDQETIDALDRGAAAGGYKNAMRLAGDVLAARSRSKYVSGMRIARLYAHAGENDRALEWLERAYERREINLVHINVGWDWDGLGSDPRFEDLRQRLNFPKVSWNPAARQ